VLLEGSSCGGDCGGTGGDGVERVAVGGDSSMVDGMVREL